LGPRADPLGQDAPPAQVGDRARSGRAVSRPPGGAHWAGHRPGVGSPLGGAAAPHDPRGASAGRGYRGGTGGAFAPARGGGVVLDTSIIVAAERGAGDFAGFLESLGDEPVAMAAITASELLHRCLRARAAGLRARRAAFVDAVLDAIPVLPFGLPEARRHAEVWAELVKRGTMIGAHDLLVGATALAHGHALATLNRREFKRGPGLVMREWRGGP